MKVRLIIFIVIIASLSFGCSVTINASTSISFVPKVYNFGKVGVNDSQIKEFKLRNISGKSIIVNNLEIQGDGKDSYSFVTGSNVPFNLQDGREQNIALKFAPLSEGNQNVKLVATFNDGRSTTEASVTGYGSIEAILEVTPSSYDFEDVGIGATVEQSFRISNTGNEVLELNNFSIEDNTENSFSITEGVITTKKDLNPGATHVVVVAFSPASVGSKTAKLNIDHGLQGSPFIVQLNGTGSDKISLSPSQHDFGTVEVGSESEYFTFTLTNPTSTNVKLSKVELSGADASSFNVSPNGNVNQTLHGNGGSLEIKVKFKPVKAGNMNATLKLTLSSGILLANLYGEGVTNPMIEIDPMFYNFGSVNINSTVTKTIKIKNTGNAGLHLTQIKLQDDVDSSFTITKGGFLSAPINPGLTHEIEIRFNPKTRGDKSANLRIDHDATNMSSPYLLALSGKGSEISFQPSFWDFGNVNINPSPVPTQKFTLTNNSNVVVTVQKITITGANAADFSASPSGDATWAVNPGAKLDVTVSCKPTVEGQLNAVLQLDLSVGTPLVATLTANGVGNPIFRILPANLDFGSVELSNSLSKSFTISNVGTGTLKISEIAIIDDQDSSFSATSGGLALGEPIINLLNGQSHNVTIKFAPLKFGHKTAKVHIGHNDSISPVPYFNMNLTGNATGAEFELIPMGTEYHFGYRIINQVHKKSFYIKNSGDKVLTVNNIYVTGAEFSSMHENLPIYIQPGHISVVDVEYKPTALGYKDGSITFSHNSVNSPYTVDLKGVGISGFTEIRENFDGSSAPSGWAGTGDWQWGVQTSSGPSSTHTPTKCWATRINNYYRNNQYCYLVSTTYDLSNTIAPKAEFWIWLRTINYLNYYKDGIWMEMSTDGGNTWTRNVNPTPAYNSTVSTGIPAYVGETTDGWEKVTMDISAAAGKSQVQFAWYFYSDNYLNSYGAFVDSFRIYDAGRVTPNNPTPVDNDINVKYKSSTLKLQWESLNASSYDVYFGTNNPPTTRVANDTPNNYYNVSVTVGKKYYWRVIANTSPAVTYGPIWCFHTVSELPNVLINEIDTINSVDWVEIYNADSKPAHIGGWQFITYSDNNSSADGTFIFPDYLILQPGQAIVVHDNQASGERYITDFNINWANASSSGEVLLLCPENYETGVDYMKFNTLVNHKPSDLAWSGSLISNYTYYSNFYRRSPYDSDNANDWIVRYRTADKGSKNPGQ